MPQRVEERLRPITPQLAWRVAVLGGIAFVLFGIVFFRLWYLQVLTGEEARVSASQNGRRTEKIEAARGDIVDTNGVQLVTTKKAAVVQLVPSTLPQQVRDQAEEYRKQVSAAEIERQRYEAQYNAFRRQLDDDLRKSTKDEKRQLHDLRDRKTSARKVPVPPIPDIPELHDLYRRISEVINVSQKTIHSRVIRGIADTPYSNVTIRTDVPPAQYNYMRERPEYFKGIVVARRNLRFYPKQDLAAQLFGTVSEISEEQRASGSKHYKGIAAGTRIGQSGLEWQYDDILRGKDGFSRVVVDAFGSRDDQRKVSVTEPSQGRRLKLTLDYNLQKAGDEALKQALQNSEYQTRAGAFIAMDASNGAVLAMGSQPSFDANELARPISQKTYEFLTSNKNDAPLLNRATASAYPTGSVFKPVTALAALDKRLISPTEKIVDDGHFEYGDKEYQNAKEAKNGSIDMSDAIKVSSDIYFFRLGAAANDKQGQIIQTWAKRLGFGRKTGIDLPGETAGLVPDADWRNSEHDKYVKCTEREHVPQLTMKAVYKCGGIERGWSGGDNVNLAVGQGDLQATPLQLAVMYSALANNGTIVTPHLAKAIQDGNGVTLQEFHTKARRKIKFDQRDRQVVLDGLRRAAQEEGGTSYDVFKDNWPMKQYPVYGKTGTAERAPNPDQAWYACFVRGPGGKTIVVAVTVEKGGFGAQTAAPAARQIAAQYFGVGDKAFHAGTSATR
jgi:penicillin-binding protein 2